MNPLTIALVIVAVLLTVVILLQQRSTGIGGAFGGDMAVFTSRRGAEKTLFRFTIVLGILLIGLTLAIIKQESRNAAVTTTTNTTTQ